MSPERQNHVQLRATGLAYFKLKYKREQAEIPAFKGWSVKKRPLLSQEE